MEVTASPEASSRDEAIDISATRRLYGWVWWALRLIYAVSFAAFIILYSLLLREPSGDLQPLLRVAHPVALFVGLWAWLAVGHPLRSVGFPALLLLALFAAGCLYGIAALIADPGRVSGDFGSLLHPVPLLTADILGPYAPALLLLGLSVVVAGVLCLGLNAALRLRFQFVAGTDWTLPAMSSCARRVATHSGDGPSLTRRLDAFRRMGWLAAAAALAALFAPLFRPRPALSIPGASWLAGRLPEGLELTSAHEIVILPALIVSILLGWLARRLLAPRGRHPLAASRRPPLLLLRSRDDVPAIVPLELWRRDLHLALSPFRGAFRLIGGRRWHRGLLSLTRLRLEDVAARSLRDAGPFVAVGDPREPQPPLGAFHAYLDDDNWKGYVRVWLCDARIVVLPAGMSDDLRWQLAAAAELDVLHKVILLMPPGTREERAARWRHVLESLPEAARRDLPGGGDARGVLAVLFDADGPAFAITSTRRGEADYDLAMRIAQGLLLVTGPAAVSRVPA